MLRHVWLISILPKVKLETYRIHCIVEPKNYFEPNIFEMKTLNYLTSFLIISVLVFSITSCNKDDIEDLEKRIAELEAITSVEDSVLFSDLVISSQASMDIMAGRGITNILGMLTISNCTDLTPLTGLKSVEGLSIQIPAGLNSLAGLEGLTTLNFLELQIDNNSVNLSVLEGLESINNLYLGGNVPSILAFPNITSMESMYIDANSASLTLAGFDELMSINYLYVNNYAGSVDIGGFAKLKSVSDLYLGANSLKISGFNSLISVNYLNLYGSSLNCSGLNGLTSLENLFLYGDNIDISGFNGLTILTQLSFSSVTLDVTGFTGLEKINYLEASIEHGVNGLNQIKNVDHLNLNIGNSDNFLTGLVSVGHLNLFSYYERTNGILSLADLGLTSLQSIGGLSLDLKSIESLNGFDFSKSSLEYLDIYNGPKLTDISALTTYTGPMMYVNIYGTNLASLDGFDNVTSINTLAVSNNTQLSNWCAIKDIFDDIPANSQHINNNLLNPASSADITGCN